MMTGSPSEGALRYRESFEKRLAQINTIRYLDIHVADHCNLRCAGCLHFAPLAEERFLDLEEYDRELEMLAAIRGFKGYFNCICLMGGEPLLHPQVAEVVRITRSRLGNESIMLSTNGLLLKRMTDAFWETLVECDVALNISPYPISVDYHGLVELARAKGVSASFSADRTGIDGGKGHFLKLALDPEGGQDPAASFAACPFGGINLQLARCALWPCQVAAHHGALERRFGYHMQGCAEDSLPLESIDSVDQIESFRRAVHPFCRHCANDELTIVEWKSSVCDPGEWTVRSYWCCRSARCWDSGGGLDRTRENWYHS